MLKKISNVKGAQKLSKKEQLSVGGGMGLTTCNSDADCAGVFPVGCIFACVQSVGLCVFDVLACDGFGG
ncbi:hypothetical protein [uncultured Dokdonia sp.]|uniref:hypothetical protein n=1 Tax=uncultured Dokdonia sp. TaxID=575653 RepID=UPI00260ED005|nr:hypothetical protein [uncultured Dokdonia sp.]